MSNPTLQIGGRASRVPAFRGRRRSLSWASESCACPLGFPEADMRRPLLLVALTLAPGLLVPAGSAGADGTSTPAIWPAGPLEVRIAFPGPVGPSIARSAEGKSIEFGQGEGLS